MSTAESAAEILARNVAFFERRTAPRTRPPIVPVRAAETEKPIRRGTEPRS